MPRSNMPPTRRKKSGEALHSEHTTRRICAEITCPCRRTGRVQRKKAFERMKELADCEIDTLTISQIQDAIDRNASTYYTRKDMKTVLSHCYNLAIAEKQTTVNLAEYIKLPKLDEKSPEPFTDADVKKLWEAYAKDHFVGFILTMIYTGMMPGELLKLKKDMIDFEKNEIVRGGIKTKKRKETPMVFPDFVAPVLHELCEESKSRVGNICCINKDNFYKRYYECLELAGVQKLPPYSCRHTTATALAMKKHRPVYDQGNHATHKNNDDAEICSSRYAWDGRRGKPAARGRESGGVPCHNRKFVTYDVAYVS